MSGSLTLDERIATALTSTDVTSSNIAALIAEVEDAAQAAAEIATKTREEALDPATVIDTIKVGTTVASAMLTRDRLQAALPRLQQQHKEVQEKEYVERWRKDFERVEAKRDALAAEYAETYPQVVERLVDLLHRVEACDREALQVNCRSPAGARAHLSNVELKARGIEQLLQPEIEIAKELRLPAFRRGVNEPLLSWPPQQPNLALQYLASMPPDRFLGHEAAAGTYLEARNRRIMEDNRRQIKEAERSQREFEQRKAAEAEAAKERDR